MYVLCSHHFPSGELLISFEHNITMTGNLQSRRLTDALAFESSIYERMNYPPATVFWQAKFSAATIIGVDRYCAVVRRITTPEADVVVKLPTYVRIVEDCPISLDTGVLFQHLSCGPGIMPEVRIFFFKKKWVRDVFSSHGWEISGVSSVCPSFIPFDAVRQLWIGYPSFLYYRYSSMIQCPQTWLRRKYIWLAQ